MTAVNAKNIRELFEFIEFKQLFAKLTMATEQQTLPPDELRTLEKNYLQSVARILVDAPWLGEDPSTLWPPSQEFLDYVDIMIHHLDQHYDTWGNEENRDGGIRMIAFQLTLDSTNPVSDQQNHCGPSEKKVNLLD